ncbi:MAG: DUF423 domain-containing protein [Gammaproteobacteria bacterium]|nr:DUF423 domain-containing protein [Gammaproteobacteria bacterium]MDE2250717.1 DUF423 domain-containing protein [Gammaproteobacteria bacterium]
MAIATIVGALAAHVLRARLAAVRYEVLQTAVLYQFIHALGLLALGALQRQRSERLLRIAADLVLAGVLLFSGSLYLLLAGGPLALGALTPLGGLCLVAGWLLAALALWRRPARAERT